MPPRFYLHKTLNSQCLKNCNKTDREELAVNEMCSLVSSNYDSLSIRCVGDWAEEKIYIISQYLGIFATGMHSKWGKVNYIEICCGPGRCIDRKSRCEFDGTSLSILKHESFKYINKALFFDYDSQVVSCLNQRIKNLQVSNAFVNHGDYNESSSICDVIRKEINPKSLTLVVIDPTDCSVPFSLIQDLSYLLPNMDLIINVASGTDFNRNALNVLSDPGKYKKVKEKYERFLGSTTFFNRISSDSNLKVEFRKEYIARLNLIGFTYSDIKEVRHYYDLIFASRNAKGLDFWQKAQKYTFDGQASLF